MLSIRERIYLSVDNTPIIMSVPPQQAIQNVLTTQAAEWDSTFSMDDVTITAERTRLLITIKTDTLTRETVGKLNRSLEKELAPTDCTVLAPTHEEGMTIIPIRGFFKEAVSF